MSLSNARARLEAIPSLSIADLPSSIHELSRLRAAIGMEARLLAKRDDAIPFGFGGNKVRKLMLVAAEAQTAGADTLITCGGVQSNHCRATAAVAAKLGLRCVLVQNGEAPANPTANAMLVRLFGAEVVSVASRKERAPTMERVAANVLAAGGKPYLVPLGASTPLGAMAFARAIGEVVAQGVRPDAIVTASSSGGTQAGLIAGCALHGLSTRVIGISADDPVATIRAEVLAIVNGLEERLGLPAGTLGADQRFEADDSFVGDGYGVPTEASREAQGLAARNEALVTDHWYAAKAMAGLIARARSGEFRAEATVLFWHTGGQVGALA